jgi:hypothetical protein
VDEGAVRQQIVNAEIKGNLTKLLLEVTDSMFGGWRRLGLAPGACPQCARHRLPAS